VFDIKDDILLSKRFSCLKNETFISNLNEKINFEVNKVEPWNTAIKQMAEQIRIFFEKHSNNLFITNQTKSDRIGVILTGSVSYGVAIEKSDIDLHLVNLQAYTREEYDQNVDKLFDSINNLTFVKSCTLLRYNKGPIIEIKVNPKMLNISEYESDITVDLSILDSQFVPELCWGLRTKYYIESRIKNSIIFRPLLIILKKLVYKRNLTATVEYGISSFLLTLTMDYFLNKTANLPSLGHYLIGFLHFYSTIKLSLKSNEGASLQLNDGHLTLYINDVVKTVFTKLRKIKFEKLRALYIETLFDFCQGNITDFV